MTVWHGCMGISLQMTAKKRPDENIFFLTHKATNHTNCSHITRDSQYILYKYKKYNTAYNKTHINCAPPVSTTDLSIKFSTYIFL